MTGKKDYIGTELGTFAEAHRWKSYWTSQIGRFVRGHVLEVGAGIGANMPYLIERASRWTWLEPDPSMASELSEAASRYPGGPIDAISGSIVSAGARAPFDTILYIDVLEHIADDVNELRNAFELLAPGGHLVVLSPAHPWLYSPFDAAVGHFRRYTTRSLTAIAPPGSSQVYLRQLDILGILLSAANRFILRSSTPSSKAIWVWDRLFVPLSRLFDLVVGYSLGRSIAVVWRK